ncbi:ADC synthase, partial [Catenaria anguillulae PL171]
ADLHPSLSALSVLQHSFPPGSMTGAPKLRTVQLLESPSAGLEGPHAPRGVYSGSIGFLSVCGGAHFNVVIRTVTGTLGEKGELMIGAGGAIVALSDPVEEWNEVLTKCGAAAGGVAAYLGQLHEQQE